MQFLYLLESIRNPVLDNFFSMITYLGSETLFLAIAIIVFWCINVPRPWVRDPEFTIVEAAREEATGYSFPSGHTQSVTASLGCIARFSKKNWICVISVVLILLTGLSRMYLGVHTPADVIVSLIIGGLLVFGLYPVFQRVKKNISILR